MGPMDPIQATGDVVKLARTNPLHFAGAGEGPASAARGDSEQKFG